MTSAGLQCAESDNVVKKLIPMLAKGQAERRALGEPLGVCREREAESCTQLPKAHGTGVNS